jgi:Sec-independent protein translocase protein TatA
MDTAVLLVAILIIVLIWRGPRTLPQLGAMLGRGVRGAREEADRIRSDSRSEGTTTRTDGDDANDGDRPAQPPAG